MAVADPIVSVEYRLFGPGDVSFSYTDYLRFVRRVLDDIQQPGAFRFIEAPDIKVPRRYFAAVSSSWVIPRSASSFYSLNVEELVNGSLVTPF